MPGPGEHIHYGIAKPIVPTAQGNGQQGSNSQPRNTGGGNTGAGNTSGNTSADGAQQITSFSSGNADVRGGGNMAAENINAQIAAASEQMAAKRAAFDKARAMVTQDINTKFSIKIPTLSAQVKAKLREYGVPITLFGEGE